MKSSPSDQTKTQVVFLMAQSSLCTPVDSWKVPLNVHIFAGKRLNFPKKGSSENLLI
jgi:hypothetical protein